MRRRDFLKLTAFGAALTLIGPWPRLLEDTDPTPFRVYMTFDDGPTTNSDLTGPTTNVLDTLKAEQIQATFFLHGRAINDWEGPVIVRMLTAGHSIGNHLWRQGGNTIVDASPLPLLAQQYIIAERRIREILLETDFTAYMNYVAQPRLFRRPGGNNGLTGFLNPKNYEVLTRAPYLQPYKGYIHWLTDVYDYSGWHINGGDDGHIDEHLPAPHRSEFSTAIQPDVAARDSCE